MFRTVPLSIIRSFSLYTQQWCMSYMFADSLRAGSGWNQISPDPARKLSAHIPLLCVQWKTPDDGQRNCPKYLEFYSKNKFEKLVHLVGFITRIYNFFHVPRNSSLWEAVSAHGIYSGISNCQTKISAIFRGVFGIFRGVSKFFLIFFHDCSRNP